MNQNKQSMKVIQSVKRGILYNYRKGELLKNIVKKEKDDLQKLELIEYIAYYYTNHITGRYSDDYLENELIRIGQKYVSFVPQKCVRLDEVLMVMTQAAETGGHTAIVKNWIEFDKTRRYSIVFTEGSIQNVPSFLIETVKQSGGQVFFLRKKSKIEKARKLLEISDGFQKVILHTHMFDLVPILAYANENWHFPVYFYNHANFRFSMGLSVSDSVLNLCKYDHIKTVYCRGVEHSSILPYPNNIKTIEESADFLEQKRLLKTMLAEQYNFQIDSKIILSMGADCKFKKIEGYDFSDFVIKLLAELPNNVFFFIIGADKKSERWQNMQKRTNGRARALGVLPRNEVTKWMKIADAYVDNFPMGAFGASEAKRYGVPCFTLRIFKRGLEFIEGLACFSIEELRLKVINSITGIEKENPTSGSRIEDRNNADRWCAILNAVMDCEIEHKVHQISPKVVIGKEEIVNYQLFENNEEITFQYNKWDCLSNKNRLGLISIEKVFNCLRNHL